VTSRERNPQFCGLPENLRRKNFAQISSSDLICENQTLISRAHGPTKASRRLPNTDWTSGQTLNQNKQFEHSNQNVKESGHVKENFNVTSASESASTVTLTQASEQSSLVIKEAVKAIKAFRKESSIVLEWDSIISEMIGFQVIYRYFGSKEFKKGPIVSANSRKYVIPHLISGDCLIVCVVPYQDSFDLKPEDISYSHCKELRGERPRIADLDKLVIGAPAAVCAFVVIAILIFTCCYRKDKKKVLPMLPPPPPPLGISIKGENEWETVSMYSSRSIPRARMYHLDSHPPMNGSIPNLTMDDNRLHLSNYLHVPSAFLKKRPTADGQSSHHSYSQLSSRFTNGACTLPHTDLTKPHPNDPFIASHINSKMNRKKSCNRLNSTSSLHSLTEYDSDQWINGHKIDNWKDNQVDVYVGKNQVVATNNNGKYFERG